MREAKRDVGRKIDSRERKLRVSNGDRWVDRQERM